MKSRGYDPRIFQMHQTQDLNETIREMRFEAQVTVNFIKALMSCHWRAECAVAMAHLKEIDPLGWERWYDMDVVDGSWKTITEQVNNRVFILGSILDFRSALQVARDLDDADTMATRITDFPRY